ncbi:hypothetical protein FZEAL_10161 [Fusarium zealandicum]|uniref:Integral membrane protein n=1 Tax=Fusarium zealandicum TaxID=1053134 RepID=A0A8H4U4X0_9HYPO|nr:hypothetical protein FZEAL_10161 [Fusarium zealandicum]
MAWLNEFLAKAGEAVDKEIQRRQQRESGYYGQAGQGQGYQQQQGGYQAGVGSPLTTTSPWQQPQYQQHQPQQQQPQQHQQPQQYQHVPPPPPYRPVSSQPQSPRVQTDTQRPTQPQAQATQTQAQAAQARAQIEAQIEASQAQARLELERSRSAQAKQLETQWRDAERLAAQYKAEYEAQMQKAQDDLSRLKIEEQEELTRLRADEARLQQRAEDDIVREQQRLLDEIQGQRPPLPPRVRTQDVAPPLPRRPGQGQESRASLQLGRQSVYPPQMTGSTAQQQASYYPPPPTGPLQHQPYHTSPQEQATRPVEQGQRGSYISPTVQEATSPVQQQTPYYPPHATGSSRHQSYCSSPQGQETSPVEQEQRGSYISPTVQEATSPVQQQAPYYPPPPTSPLQQESHRASPQEQTTGSVEQGQSTSSYRPPTVEDATSPLQQHAPYYPPPPETSPDPATQGPSQPQSEPASPPKPPRVTTPEPIKEHASGITPLSECSSIPTQLPQHWVYHPDSPKFVICAHCYVDHIYNTKFRDSFTKVYYGDEEARRCRFETQRLKEKLFPAAVESGSLDDCVAFMKKRMTIRDCQETTQIEGEMWYMTPDIPHTTICQACFEDGLWGTPFAKHYRLQASQGAAYCDSVVWFVRRKYMEYAKEDNWAKFAEEFSARLQLPPCPKTNNIKANDRAWFKPKDGPGSLQACVTCYYDYFYRSEDEDKFEQVSGGDFETRCNMGQLNMVIPMAQALNVKDRSIFWKAAHGVDKHPFCHKDGIKGGTWYSLPNDAPGFGICGACYEGIVKPVGGASWFIQERDVPQDRTYLCCFNLNHARVQGALAAYINSRSLGDWRQLGDYAKKWTLVRPCPKAKRKSGKNRPWWGWGVLSICEECYLLYAQGTALEPRFALKGAREPDNERMCDIFSARVRPLYMEACTTGDLDSLLVYADQRRTVYAQTIMRCEQILAEARMAAWQAQRLGIQGSFYKNMGNMHDTVVGHSYTVGNSYAGYGHANEWVLEGHAYDRQASEARAQAGRGNGAMIRMLEARWKEVE